MSLVKNDHITVNTQNSIRNVNSKGTVIYIDPLGIAGKPADADLILIGEQTKRVFSSEKRN